MRFFTLTCRDWTDDDADYHELMSVLKRRFGAVETGELAGPYSIHKYVSANGISFAIILDWPDCLDLYARDERDVPGLESFVARVLEALNDKGNA